MAWPEAPRAFHRMSRWLERWPLLGRKARCLDGWGRVWRALGEPQSILCLGNGPSSEDPALKELRFDCLFRVNWIWQTRGMLNSPHAIFTADREVPRSAPDAIIGFPTRADADDILDLYDRAAVSPRNGYFVMEELPSPLTARNWPLRPTNGALMIAAAVQLRPANLTIAGIDLYRHPAGKYPGETAEANDYDAIHSRENDLEAIRLALSGYAGTLTLVGDQLRAALGPVSSAPK